MSTSTEPIAPAAPTATMTMVEAIRDALTGLEVASVTLPPAHLANVNAPADLEALRPPG